MKNSIRVAVKKATKTVSVVRPQADPAMRLRALELAITNGGSVMPANQIVGDAETFLKFLVP